MKLPLIAGKDGSNSRVCEVGPDGGLGKELALLKRTDVNREVSDCFVEYDKTSSHSIPCIVQSTLSTEVVKIIEVAMGWPEVAVTKLATR
jgi:hypothetical protein